MLIEVKSLELKNIETVLLIKRELEKAREAQKGLLIQLHKKLTRKLNLLANIAKGLSETLEYYASFFDEFKNEGLASLFFLHHNLCIKDVWDKIMATLTELLTSTGTISLDVEELKELSWLDIKNLAQTFGEVYICDYYRREKCTTKHQPETNQD